MDADFDATLRADDAVFGAADAALLRAVAAEGSVSGAARSLGRSRSRALGRLETLEAAFGPLVERRRGGFGGGGSRLTDEAEALLARFARLRAALSGTAGVTETVLSGRVSRVTGELAAVETDAGRVRALFADEATDARPTSEVEVSVRADAVTLHAPADAPSADATSARNRFAGEVVGVDRGEAVVRVAVDIGASDPLVALITADSAERLALDSGASVVASFKATATRATPPETVTDAPFGSASDTETDRSEE